MNRVSCVVACLLLVTTEARSEDVLFSFDLGGDHDIYALRGDGLPVNLTRHQGADVAPVPSPDGTRIAFLSDRDGSWGIYVMDAGGGDGVHLTRSVQGLSWFSQLAWSPDGTRIAFAAAAVGDPDSLGQRVPKKLYVLGLDGSLVDLDAELASTHGVRGFPDIVRKHYDTFVWGGEPVRAADERRLGYSPAESRPAWSPDGRHIAYVSRDWDVHVAAVDGGERRNLSAHAAADLQPAWSPDGRWIAFASGRDSIVHVGSTGNGITYVNWELYLAAADGSALHNLTRSHAFEGGPVWSPDGTRIAYELKNPRLVTFEASSYRFEADFGYCVGLLTFDAAGPPAVAAQGPVDCPARGISRLPVFSPDADRLAFWSLRGPRGTFPPPCVGPHDPASGRPACAAAEGYGDVILGLDLTVEGGAALPETLVASGGPSRLGPPVYAPRPPITAVTDRQASPGRAFRLGQSYPNPINPATTIPFSLTAPGPVQLSIFNLQGQRVKRLIDGRRDAGRHAATWDGTDADGRRLASGVYLYRLHSGGRQETRKLLLVE